MLGSLVNQDLKAIETEARTRLVKSRADNETWFSQLAAHVMNEDLPAPDPSVLIEAQIACMRHLYASRDRRLAISIGERALVLAANAKLIGQERFLCNFMGIFHKDLGQHVVATEYFIRAIGISRRMGNQQDEATSWAGMANLANMMGLSDDCIKFARRAIALVSTEPTEIAQNTVVSASQLIARACQALGRHEEALNLIRDAVGQMRPPRSTLDYLMRVRFHHTYTVIALRLQEHAEARVAALAAADDASHCAGAEAAVLSGVANAMVDASVGELDAADRTTRRLLSEFSGDKTLLFDLYVARLYVLERAGRHKEAEALSHQYRDEWKTHKLNGVVSQLHILEDAERDNPAATTDNAVRERLEELAIIGELNDDATGEHAFRVGRLAGLMAKRMGMNAAQVESIDIAARLHDIGKITTPPEILNKTSKLTDGEFAIIKEHAEAGFKILATRSGELMEMASLIALHHHEWWDGSGYPRHLSGNAIPLPAQFSALADVFDALTHARCYKKAWTIENTFEEIQRLSGNGPRALGETPRQQFSTELSREFVAMVRELIVIHGEAGLDKYLSERAQFSAFRNARAAAAETLASGSLGLLQPIEA